MNAFSIFCGRRPDTVGDAEALRLMLDYIAAEAERLGLHLCASHAESARDAIAYETDRPMQYQI